MRPDADKLVVRRHPAYAEDHGYPECSCGDGHVHVEAEWPIHGWRAHSGQCCDCMNVRVYSNGSEPADWDSGDEARVVYADKNSDEIHICDLSAFIEMLQAILAASTTTTTTAVVSESLPSVSPGKDTPDGA